MLIHAHCTIVSVPVYFIECRCSLESSRKVIYVVQLGCIYVYCTGVHMTLVDSCAVYECMYVCMLCVRACVRARERERDSTGHMSGSAYYYIVL